MRRGQRATREGTIIVSDTSTGSPPRSLDIYIFLHALVILRPLMNNLLWESEGGREHSPHSKHTNKEMSAIK